MSSCCRRNPNHSYGIANKEGQWSEDQIARSLAAGIISEDRARELLASIGSTTQERRDNRVDLVGRAMAGDSTAAATLDSYGLDWRLMDSEQQQAQSQKMLKYGAAAVGIAGLAYFFTKGKK